MRLYTHKLHSPTAEEIISQKRAKKKKNKYKQARRRSKEEKQSLVCFCLDRMQQHFCRRVFLYTYLKNNLKKEKEQFYYFSCVFCKHFSRTSFFILKK